VLLLVPAGPSQPSGLDPGLGEAARENGRIDGIGQVVDGLIAPPPTKPIWERDRGNCALVCRQQHRLVAIGNWPPPLAGTDKLVGRSVFQAHTGNENWRALWSRIVVSLFIGVRIASVELPDGPSPSRCGSIARRFDRPLGGNWLKLSKIVLVCGHIKPSSKVTAYRRVDAVVKTV